MKLIERIVQKTNEYIDQMPKTLRKKYGQFFTSKDTAVFMAGLFTIPENVSNISILDPGAGSGILSAAIIDRLQSFEHISHVYLTCYENDPNVSDLLKDNLEWLKNNSTVEITYSIKPDNYILSQADDYCNLLGGNIDPVKYNIIISNPPYMKIPKEAPEAYVMRDVCYGAPNLYFLFAAMSLFNLKNKGEMVYIIPRSWTSGAYFKKFREKLYTDGVLEHIHLFSSRNKVFEKENVLQETIIIKVKKTNVRPANVIVTTTQSNADFSQITEFKAPYSTVVSDKEYYIYPVTNQEEVTTLNKINRLKNTLPQLGLKMKTGLTIDFRNQSLLRDKADINTVPLFYAQHIKNGKVLFPIGKEHEYIDTSKKGLIQKNTNYLFVKRFTAKEEHRRLQCGVYLSQKNPSYKEISTQNKINFICGAKELSECIVYGLYVLFNSTLYDNYYRILNGSTQVNSTEINAMPVPSLKIIETLGKKLIQNKDMSETVCDNILRSCL